MNQQLTPLYSKLVDHYEKNPVSLHVPGHKNGRVFPTRAHGFENILRLDVTELTGLDDLHDATGVIKEAEELTANHYGARRSFFLVNGSTVGNLAMILAVCEEDATVLVQRNSHKSILHGLQLSGAKPVFLTPEYDDEVKVSLGISLNTVKEAISSYPSVKAIILSNPNYYGMSVDLRGIVEYAHNRGIPVLVDEAHGAHFSLEGFPMSALEAGADVVVNSAHKTLPAMTMGSFIHVNSNLVKDQEIGHYLQMLQSSSPSYPIMASLDLARFYLATMKKKQICELLAEIKRFTYLLNEIPQLKVVGTTNKEIETDPLKVTIQSKIGMNGFELQALFENNGIYTEMADPNNVLMVLPLSKEHLNTDELIRKIRGFLAPFPIIISNQTATFIETDKITELALCYKQIKGYNKKVVSLNEAVGQISAEMIIPYPPGIPVLMTGEYITNKHITIITNYMKAGTRFQGNNLEHLAISIFEGNTYTGAF
ncbi:aminotransferase class I/II-fold pyridoxal phosphate-dependent enzyme [Litchfieldia salsa]|uniref:Arginine/lysine/ornithine decarboxylase n=1 Tax=Litchfieldia salsa TaxID=930152 RepID=A0A1H0WZU2_9BACI|nr:aminotransferase class I/II-fold pyridoxal phosphate-dependent enzyme [Litchfieldia salsa]SDP96130.1 Arginine/lysine/ornithine decarboxylase [Litchfieldia salsa]